MKTDVGNRVNEGYELLGGMKRMKKNMRMSTKKTMRLYEKIFAPTVMYRPEVKCMPDTEKQKVNVFEIKMPGENGRCN